MILYYSWWSNESLLQLSLTIINYHPLYHAPFDLIWALWTCHTCSPIIRHLCYCKKYMHFLLEQVKLKKKHTRKTVNYYLYLFIISPHTNYMRREKRKQIHINSRLQIVEKQKKISDCITSLPDRMNDTRTVYVDTAQSLLVGSFAVPWNITHEPDLHTLTEHPQK